jgi:hypothetical protein
MNNEDLVLELEDHFDRFGWTWSLKGRGTVHPDRYDIEAALDAAAASLYAEGDTGGNMLQTGRLIVIKNDDLSLDVYVLAGTIPPKENE